MSVSAVRGGPSLGPRIAGVQKHNRPSQKSGADGLRHAKSAQSGSAFDEQLAEVEAAFAATNVEQRGEGSKSDADSGKKLDVSA
ncbi:MAG TPA: hypothetical protein VEU47_00510 [Candidatus Cybelea sp.]|nr:hypothetical protein [Candidatus Cybelea sp.]